ncbi:transcriptional regulator, HxlR family [Amphibacillus marinus]|uniref:Transcriptional regulator, HxlR family n=1 Tax=Amphibacillus marinus TaxID=872970 RepID=A0A1H8M934_9BACI|nr:helix-turn-helix domain-containing protein [Amphibacillus marinus]SEO13912.1 transcriptional regulator, HxlR family [Amphibacillus marinus]
MRETENHPIEVTMDVVCGKWKAIILFQLLEGTIRYNELHRKVSGISKKMLTQQLRELEQDLLIKRMEYDELPTRVEYELTTYGRNLEATLYFMAKWGSEHREKMERSGA